MSKHFHTLSIKELKKETLNTVSIIFNIPESLKEAFKYDAGQYLTLRKTINGEDIRRSYSISSYQTLDDQLQISCKMINGGKMSTYLFKELGVGDSLDVMSPDGNFRLKDSNQSLVLFAAGSGITPIISILKKALTEGSRMVHLYYGNRTEEEIIFKNELENLRKEYVDRLMVQHYLSSNGERLDKERTSSIINGLNKDANGLNYFVCGPEGMISAVKEGLLASNVSESNITIEYFATPKVEKETVEVLAPTSTDVNELTIVLDDEEHQLTLMNGESILDGAGRIGVDPPFSCQSGVCTTCKAKVLSGEVEMENNFGLGEDEIEEGFVLTCIGKPETPGVKVSWDEV